MGCKEREMAASDQVEFGHLLRRHRKRAGATQRQLADLSTVSIRGIRDLEAGRVRHPRPDTVRLLGDGLRLKGSSLEEFLLTATDHDDDAPVRGGPMHDPDPVPLPVPVPVPVPVNSTFGRRAEISLILDRLAEGQRFISITGLHGVGKTRLALEVANAVNDRSDTHVWWIPASADGDLTGADQGCIPPGRLATERSAELLKSVLLHPEDIADLIGGGSALIFMDAVDDLAADRDWIGRLLTASSSIKVVCTLAEPMHLPGEWTLPLAPLPVPTTADDSQACLADVPSVRLFVSRISHVRPSFHLQPYNRLAVAGICRTVDGLPSALEHAALLCLAEPPAEVLRELSADPLSALSANGCSRDTRRDIQDSLQGLSATVRGKLRDLSLLDGYWSIPEAAHRLGTHHRDLSPAVREIFLRGYLRCRETCVAPQFQVLGLVSAIASALPPRSHFQTAHLLPPQSAVPRGRAFLRSSTTPWQRQCQEMG
jgi:transcriptional regulator with XRE-family HTH domain